MSKRTVIFALLFIAGISLLNVAVLIEASNQEDALFVDPFEQQPVPASIHYNKRCNKQSNSCSIDNTKYDCVQRPLNCYDQRNNDK